jgi:hypothetical protein
LFCKIGLESEEETVADRVGEVFPLFFIFSLAFFFYWNPLFPELRPRELELGWITEEEEDAPKGLNESSAGKNDYVIFIFENPLVLPLNLNFKDYLDVVVWPYLFDVLY